MPISQLTALSDHPAFTPLPRAVTLDVGGTLIRPHPSVGAVYAEVAKTFGIQVDAQKLDQQFRVAWKNRGDFGYALKDWERVVEQSFEPQISPPLPDGMFAKIYETFARARSWKIYDDVLPALKQLKESGIRLSAISNWDERLEPLLEELDLRKWFETVVTSHACGARKPSPAIFQAAAEQMKLAPREILHVGDEQIEDYQGAMAAGFRAVLLQR